MERKKEKTRSEIAFKLSEKTKALVNGYVKAEDTTLSRWMRVLIREYLIEQKVLDKDGNLINGWGDPSKMKKRNCPHHLAVGFDAVVGIAVFKDSPLFIGFKHYSAGNSPDATNMSALLRFLVDRELRRAGVLRQNGELTAAWKGKIGITQKVAA